MERLCEPSARWLQPLQPGLFPVVALGDRRQPGSGLTAAARPAASANRRFDALRRAVAAGLRDVAFMRRDPDLDALRPRPDFQILIMDLAFPDNPFAR